MKILGTGAKGFVGLCAQLKHIRDGKAKNYGLGGRDSSLPLRMTVDEVYEYDLNSTPEELDAWCAQADFVFNLAGVNRPQNQGEFMQGNFGFASTLLDTRTTGELSANSCPTGGQSKPTKINFTQLGPTWPSWLQLGIK